jgi:hypothetical protein
VACAGGAAVNTLAGVLLGRKHTAGDYLRGLAKGCAEGVLMFGVGKFLSVGLRSAGPVTRLLNDAAETAAKTADDWPVISGILRDASKSKGNFGLGSGTASQAQAAGQSWVGDGYTIASDGRTLISRDGLRAFRPPSFKPRLGRYQANFESWVNGQVTRKPVGNGHLDITDMGP